MRYVFFTLALLVTAAQAQEPADRYGTISGIVLDSLQNQPLADAEVSTSPSGLRTRSDSEGRFSIEMVRPGKYDVTATHPVADSLGIKMTATGIVVTAGQNARLVLALPGEQGTRRLICPEGPVDGLKGSIRGRVMRTPSGNAAEGAQVTLSWLEISFKPGTHPDFIRREVSTLADIAGYYSFCGLPEDFEGSIQALSAGDSTGLITVGLSFRPFGIAYRPLLLPSRSAAGQSSGRLEGKVVDSAGRPLSGATIEIVGNKTSARSRGDGSFSLSNVPTGTRMLRARKIGYFSRVIDVAIDSHSETPARVTLDKQLPQLVDVVVREMATTVADKTGFKRRAFAGPGRYATLNDLAKNPSRCVLDGLKFFIPRGQSMCSTSRTSTSMVHFRGVSTLRGLQTLPAGEASQRAGRSSSGACLSVFIDDNFEYPDLNDEISLTWLPRNEVVGIEYYSAASSPGRLAAGGCSVMLIWTIWYRGSHH